MQWTQQFKALFSYHKIVQSEKKKDMKYVHIWKCIRKIISLDLGSVSKIRWKKRMKMQGLEKRKSLSVLKEFYNRHWSYNIRGNYHHQVSYRTFIGVPHANKEKLPLAFAITEYQW